jgi:WD40 repeat protein
MVVATGEAALDPHLHIWSIVSLEPLNIIKTYHKNGISQCAFSQDGNFIVSVGMDKQFSM